MARPPASSMLLLAVLAACTAVVSMSAAPALTAQQQRPLIAARRRLRAAAAASSSSHGPAAAAAAHALRRRAVARRLQAAAAAKDLAAARRLQGAAAARRQHPRRRKLAQAPTPPPTINFPKADCTALALSGNPMEPCAEPSCFPFYQIRRSAATGDVVCANVAPFPAPAPAPAPSLGFVLAVPYDYDYLFDTTGDNVLVGASSVNRLSSADTLTDSERTHSFTSVDTASTSNRIVPTPALGFKGELQASVIPANASAAIRRDGASPLTLGASASTGVTTAGLGGAYIPGTSYAERDTSSDEGTTQNVVVRPENPALFGFLFGRRR